MQQPWTAFLSILASVALTSSIKLVLENTDNNDWRDWTIKEAPQPPGTRGVSLKIYRQHGVLKYKPVSISALSSKRSKAPLAECFARGNTSTVP